MDEYDHRRQFWDMAFCSMLGMNLHPGTTRDQANPLSFHQLAVLADEALKERDERFP